MPPIGGTGRQNALIKSPNVHIEVGYTEALSHVIGWMDKIMADDPVATSAAAGQQADQQKTQVMAYLAVKISYPLDIVNPHSFRAIAVLFLYSADGNSRRPVGIWSFGTLPATDATRNWLCTLLNSGPGNANTLDPITHAVLFRGDWVNGADPPCTAAHAEHPAYTVTIPGDAMTSIDRHHLPVGVDTTLYDCHISLFAVSHPPTIHHHKLLCSHTLFTYVAAAGDCARIQCHAP